MSTKCPKCHSDNPPNSKFCNSCGLILDSIDKIPISRTKTVETPAEELTTGSTFAGRYQIIEELGKGGMGWVYKVLDKETKEKIALKLIKPDIASDKKTIERFRNELTSARKIVQKNVCRMYDLNKEQNNYYITMEFVSGGDLKKLIRRTKQLAVGTVISIAKQICDGLSEAHSQGIVHRDLKPNNIMIDDNGNVRIMDFGIARTIKGKGITGSGVIIGTPEYMSPEQVEAKDIDQRSDIYSLGIIMYEMLTGRLPFEADTPFAIGVKHKSEAPTHPKELNPQIPDDLSGVILKCLEKDRENRYQSAADVQTELEKIEQGLPTTDRDIPTKKPLTSKEITVQFNLKKIFIPVFVAILVLVIGLLIWSPWSQKDKPVQIPSNKPSLAILYFRNGTGDSSLDHWKETICEYLITDLSQSKYIHVLDFFQIVSILDKQNLIESNRYSSEDLNLVAASGGASHILTGSFSKPGQSFRIDYFLYDVKKGERVGSDRLEGAGEDRITSMVDKITVKVKEHLNLTQQQIAFDLDKEVGTITTKFPDAYDYYRRGRRYFLRGETEQAVMHLEKAIEIDPNFAIAYRALSTATRGNPDKRKELARKAFELRDNASEEERMVIEAYYSNTVEGNREKQLEICEKIVVNYPNNSYANATLGNRYSHLEDWDKVIKHCGIQVKNRQEYRPDYTTLGNAYEAKGMYEKAREVYQTYIYNIMDSAAMHHYLAMTYIFEGRYDEALEELEKAELLDPGIAIDAKINIKQLQGDFEAAEKEYQSWVEDERPAWKMDGWRNLEILYRTLGQYKKARGELQKGLKFAEDNNLGGWVRSFIQFLSIHDLCAGNLSSSLKDDEFLWDIPEEEKSTTWKLNILSLKIEVYLEQNNIDKAMACVEETKKMVDETPSLADIRIYYRDLALVEIKQKNYAKAVDLLKQAYELQGGQRSMSGPHARTLYQLASARYLNGDLEGAKKEYENILALTTGRLFYGDYYAKSFYELGKINEELENKSEAVKHYEKFLNLWKNADPGLPEVDDAKERLAGLKE